MKYRLRILSVLILLGGALNAQQLTQSFTFLPMDVQTSRTGIYDVVMLEEESYLLGEEYAGEPQLPVKQFNLLLPQGASATNVQLTINSQQQLVGSFYLYPVQLPVYANFEDPPPFVEPDSAIYGSDNPYPTDYFFEYSTSGFRDYNYVTINFTPFSYLPLSGQLFLFTDLTITINYTTSTLAETHKLRPYGSVDEAAYEMMERSVTNPLQLDAFYPATATKISQYRTAEGIGMDYKGTEPTELPNLNGCPVHYVIITNNSDVNGNALGDFTGKFQELADWKTQSGTFSKVVTVDDIRVNYQGVDVAEQIREFIKDAHKLWGTEYVLLGGNASVVPVRWIPGMPTDLYYSAIWHPSIGYDDNWNSNGDTQFGDASSNFTPDLAVGRAPVDTEDEVDLFLKKNFTYARCSYAYDYYEDPLWEMPDGAWLNKQLNFSGIIHYNNWPHTNLGLYITWKITENFSDDSEQYTMHEYKGDWFTTYPSWSPAYYPTDPNAVNPSGIPINDEYVGYNEVITQLNQRYGIINHDDHSGTTGLGLNVKTNSSSITGVDFRALYPSDKYPVFVSGGCHVCPIDLDYYVSE